jgi:hypothetical protein
MKKIFRVSRATSLLGVFLGILACLILSTSFYSLLERGGNLALLIALAVVSFMAVATTGYLIYSFRRSG